MRAYMHARDCTNYVNGFVKNGLACTSDLQTSTIHNFRCVSYMDL